MPQAKWKVSFELSGSLPDFKRLMQEVVRISAHSVRNEWIKVARKTLHSSARKYIEGIEYPEIKKNVAIIRLGGKFPNMIENGSPPFDMKPGLLKSRKAKRSKDGGKYITVPLALKTPGGGNRGPSPPVMPGPIYRSAAKLQFGQSMSRLPVKYENLGRRTRLSPDLKKWGHYTWKTSPFVGVTKVQKYPGELPTSSTGKMAGYKTFRRVSTKSDPNSWIHPGFRKGDIMERTALELDKIFPEVMNAVMGVG
jgi:hypothetical protein